MTPVYYYDLEGLKNIYLEDSYVLNVDERKDEIVFDLDLVLHEDHELYRTPGENGQYCYRRARIVFPKVQSVKWKEKRFEKFTDVSGEVDYGNIDEFYRDNGKYYLNGSWGDIEISSMPPRLTFS